MSYNGFYPCSKRLVVQVESKLQISISGVILSEAVFQAE
jgi:hypothetical protein